MTPQYPKFNMTRHFSWLSDYAEKLAEKTITFEFNTIELQDTDHLHPDAQDVLSKIFMDMDSKGLSEITYYI